MGVPAFFRWISEKYPRIMIPAVEEDSPNPCEPNPNNYEFDNLYLDMNGLIHPCTHPEGEEAPPTEEEMYLAIYRYLDRLINMIRPRKIIYMAIDGVAPRAKMNQQRSRRFRAAQEAEEAKLDKDKIKRELIRAGMKLPPRKPDPWDSNVITPGTEFMATLSDWIRHYIVERINNNPAFKNVRVILSDAQSPGEGEHKIMQFIRRERAEPGYDPNTSHVLYGLDADLIMLGLASHEMHFTILREQVLFGKKNQNQGYKTDAVLLDNGKDNSDGMGMIGSKPKKPFDLVRIWILREYLAFEFRPESFYQPLPFPYDLEKCLDDFVFMCFFVGNDFLPHLPALSIKEGGLELLLDLYHRILPTVGGYLTNDGTVHLERVDVFVAVLGTVEDEIFKRRRSNDLFMEERRKQQKATRNAGGHDSLMADAVRKGNVAKRRKQSEPPPLDPDSMVALGRGRKDNVVKPKSPPSQKDNKSAAAALRASLGQKRKVEEVESTIESEKEEEEESELFPEVDFSEFEIDTSEKAKTDFETKVKAKERERNIKEGVVCEVRYGDIGWKDRYYLSKFGSEYTPGSIQRRKVAESYITGLCWVMEYYYRGCQSWTWYYEYHYAPMASDLVNIDQIKVEFPHSIPFRPIDQLMGVLPSNSAHALPEPCRWYMCDPNSSIYDFYPKTFSFDANGKAMRWLWIALLPFIDEKRLLEVTNKLEKEFSAADLERNKTNPDVVFTHVQAAGSAAILKAVDAYEKKKQARAKLDHAPVEKKTEIEFTPKTAGDVRAGSGENGRLVLANESKGIGGYFLPPPMKYKLDLNTDIVPVSRRLSLIQKNKALCFEFRLPPMREHLSRILPNTRIPTPSLGPYDFKITVPRFNNGPSVANLLSEQHGKHPGVPQSKNQNNMPFADAMSQSGLQRGNQTSWGSMEPKRHVRNDQRYNERNDQRYNERNDQRYNERNDQRHNDQRYKDSRQPYRGVSHDSRRSPPPSRERLLDDLSAALQRRPGNQKR